MALFKLLWLRRFIRRNTNPVPQQHAEKWQRKLSYLYMLFAWQAFGVVGYLIYTGKSDWAAYYGVKDKVETSLSPAQQWTKVLGIKDATVYRVSGLRVSRYEIHNDFAKEKGETKPEEVSKV